MEERGLSVTVMSPSEKRLNRSRWRLDCGLRHGIMGVHISATLQIRLNRPCAAAMGPYVTLLLPPVIVIIRPHRPYYVSGCGLLLPTE